MLGLELVRFKLSHDLCLLSLFRFSAPMDVGVCMLFLCSVMRVEVEHVEGAKGQPVAICRWQGPLQSPADSGARRQNIRGARNCRAG